VTLGEEPTAATMTMIPPLFLETEFIVPHVDIGSPFYIANVEGFRRPGIILSAIAELLHAPQSTVWAIDLDHPFST
jgi:hypothetical protein